MKADYIILLSIFLFLRIGVPYNLIIRNQITEKRVTESTSSLSEKKTNPIVIDSSEIEGSRIIAKYISAIGGKDTINKIMDRTTFITGKVRNMSIHIVVYQKIPNKYYQKINLGAAEQKIIYDGKRGVTITGDNEQEIRGIELNKLKYDATMQLLLYLKAYDVRAIYEGKEKIKDKFAFKVILKLPDNMEWIQYYDTTTYLKLKEIKPISSPNSKMVNQITFFTNYKKVEGVKYPFRINQTLGTSQFIFHVDSIKVNTGLSDRNFEID